MARAGFAGAMLHGSRTPPTASASVAPSTGRPKPLVRMLYLNNAPLANWKVKAMKNATAAKNGVQKPAISAPPQTISPNGTIRAKCEAYGIATRSRYAWLHDAPGTACDQ